jgi:UNC-50 family
LSAAALRPSAQRKMASQDEIKHPLIEGEETTSLVTAEPSNEVESVQAIQSDHPDTDDTEDDFLVNEPEQCGSDDARDALALSQYVSRTSNVRQVGILSALDQMRMIVSFRPKAVYKAAYDRKQTKNHWHRDDPAFCVALAAFLGVSVIAYSYAFRLTIFGTISFFLYSILWNFLGCGIILASICREIANRHLSSNSNLSMDVKQQVEWLYSFDIHCNAFFAVVVLLCKCYRFNGPLTIFPFGKPQSMPFNCCRRGSVFPAARGHGRKLCRVNPVKYLVRSGDIVGFGTLPTWDTGPCPF